MSYKPDEATWIAYLYGELGDDERELFERYLAEHPTERARLRELRDVRSIIGGIGDKEVIAPPVFIPEHDARPWWQARSFRISLGMAASIVFLLVAGKLIGPEIRYRDGELRISFSGKPAEEKKPTLTEQQVQAMIHNTLASHDESQRTERAEDQRKLMQTLTEMNSKKIDALTRQASQASRDQVQAFVASLQDQNLKLMKDYFQLSSTEQKKYMESLLVDFSTYLQDQRKQDLQLVQNKMNYLERNSNQFRQETEQLLTSLISQPARTKNNY